MYLVIDIGGTKTLIAVFSHRGKIIRKVRFKTPEKRQDFEAMLEATLIPFSVKYSGRVRQIIVAVPGWVDQNVAVKFGNRPWRNFNIAKLVNNLFNETPVALINDANLATIYESSFHKGLTLYLTFSTGIGGGLARKTKLAKNTDAVEPGHVKYIWDGKHQEWEDISSCAAIGRDYNCQATSVRGEKAYLDIAHRVSLGLPELIHKYHPDFIVIGGPLGLLFERFEKPLKTNLKQIMKNSATLPHIVPAKRPKESVIYGGYLYAKIRDKAKRK